MIFNPSTCFQDAIYCAQLMNATSKYLLNRYFKANEVECGIGIDFGRMMVTKTGVRRHGVQRQNYHSLVWLGRPANVASKLTDAANKSVSRNVVNVATKRIRSLFGFGGALSSLFPQQTLGDLLGATPTPLAATAPADDWEWNEVELKDFVENLDTEWVGLDKPKLIKHKSQNIEAFFVAESSEDYSVPPILMTKAVYDGYRHAKPNAKSITEKWYSLRKVKVSGYTGEVYGGDVIYNEFKS